MLPSAIIWSIGGLYATLFVISCDAVDTGLPTTDKIPAVDLPQLSESTDGKELPILSLPIPEDVVHTWPAPDYINPQSRKGLLLMCEVPLIVITSLSVAGRLYGRGIVARRWSLGLDDWLMCGSLLFAIALTTVEIIACDYGWGVHIWDIQPGWIVPMRKLAFTTQVFFTLCVTLCKLSILTFYLRLSASPVFRLFVYVGIFYNTGFAISFLVAIAVQCRPLQAFWDLTIEAVCINESAANTANAVLNTFGDFYVYVLPLRILWTLHLPTKQRIGLVVLFSLGLIVCIAGCLRVWHLQNGIQDTYDSTWAGPILYILTAIECDLSIVCGCIPALKPIWTKYNGKLRGQIDGDISGSYKNSGRAMEQLDFHSGLPLCLQEQTPRSKYKYFRHATV